VTLTLFLLRHAAHDDVGRFLAGRSEPVCLGEEGRRQALRLGARMQREGLTEIYTSPRTRTQETAAAVATACRIASPQPANALDEVDFGQWSGKRFDDLDSDPAWRRWNTVRSLVRAPGGETVLEVQNRVMGFIKALQGNLKDGKRVALVSHADVIKTAVSHVLGLPADAWPRFDIAPASVTTIVIGDWGAKIVTLNEITP
jgi:broad specificity phosphatase PhoE